jgi:hypothetical protein
LLVVPGPVFLCKFGGGGVFLVSRRHVSMKKTIALIVLAVIAASLLLAVWSRREASAWHTLKAPETVKLLKQFTGLKEAQANAATNALPPEINSLFKAADRGDWLTLSNAFMKLGERNGNYAATSRRPHGKIWTAVEDFVSYLKEKTGWLRHVEAEREGLRGTQWEAIKEVWGAFDAFIIGNEKYSTAFGRDIIDSIPAGSVYFGGTDPGRFIVTAMSKSQPDADPFFTLTQNALADGSYLDYLRSMYGGDIYIPTPADSQKCFQDYVADAQMRMTSGRLKPGEDVKTTGGRVQVSGQTAVMEINGLLAKIVFDKNPGREFYLEESFPLDWMYPHLEPHGLIMKINREPLTDLSDEIVQTDTDYWEKQVTPMIGGWLDQATPVEVVAAFAEKIHEKKDLGGFTGDPQFVQNEHACKMFSKLRSSIAGLYAWRAQHAANAGEKQRMNDAADFAFRQAFALCPYSPEAVFRYVNLLLSENRAADALLVAETAGKMPALQGRDGEPMRALITQLQQFRKQK